MSITTKERRKNREMTEHEMYRLDNLEDVIEKERRHSQLEKLLKVKKQKDLLKKVLVISVATNVVFVLFAIWNSF